MAEMMPRPMMPGPMPAPMAPVAPVQAAPRPMLPSPVSAGAAPNMPNPLMRTGAPMGSGLGGMAQPAPIMQHGPMGLMR